jgi:uncharacterized membrane protein YgdD (TMEM256/DUF423 family)
MTTRTAQLIGSALALLGVILGAFGAHFLRHTLTANGPLSVEAWQTGIFYQWVHALAFLALAGRVRFETALCWLSGVVLFSGSLPYGRHATHRGLGPFHRERHPAKSVAGGPQHAALAARYSRAHDSREGRTRMRERTKSRLGRPTSRLSRNS